MFMYIICIHIYIYTFISWIFPLFEQFQHKHGKVGFNPPNGTSTSGCRSKRTPVGASPRGTAAGSIARRQIRQIGQSWGETAGGQGMSRGQTESLESLEMSVASGFDLQNCVWFQGKCDWCGCRD